MENSVNKNYLMEQIKNFIKEISSISAKIPDYIKVRYRNEYERFKINIIIDDRNERIKKLGLDMKIEIS